MGDIRVRSLRADDETFTKLRKVVQDGGFASQGEALTQLISFWELNNAAEAMPDHKDAIDSFNALINQLQQRYIELLDSTRQTKEKIELKYNGQLAEARAKIDSLKSTNAYISQKYKEAEDRYAEQSETLSHLDADFHNLNKKYHACEDAAIKLQKLQEKYIELQNKYIEVTNRG